MPASTYSVTLHHLSPDATAAGLDYPDEQLPTVTVAQLRELLFALSAVAAKLTIYEPSTPEIRVKTDREIFIIRTRYRRLCFVGWETILRGEDHSVAYIMSTVTGTQEQPVKTSPKLDRPYTPSHASNPPVDMGVVPRWAKITVLAVLIIGFNAVTAWMLLRPPPTLVPKHELLSESESRALMIKTSGEYETGTQEGARRLVIDPDGVLRLAKFGPQRTVLEERRKPARGALVDGRTALITADGVVVLKDADTVVYFGIPYHRHGS
jgi:hypothetical protein